MSLAAFANSIHGSMTIYSTRGCRLCLFGPQLGPTIACANIKEILSIWICQLARLVPQQRIVYHFGDYNSVNALLSFLADTLFETSRVSLYINEWQEVIVCVFVIIIFQTMN